MDEICAVRYDMCIYDEYGSYGIHGVICEMRDVRDELYESERRTNALYKYI